MRTLAALQGARTRPAPCGTSSMSSCPTWIGEVAGVDEVALPSTLDAFDCRNNRLAWLGLQQDGFADAARRARERWGAQRVAVFLGTSTSGICRPSSRIAAARADGSLPADFRYAQTQNTYSLAAFVAQALGARTARAVWSRPRARRARRCSATRRG